MHTTEKEAIFLVDDNPANLRAGKSVLMENYSVYTAAGADRMFELLAEKKPALILLDINMPEMNGYQAIRQLKSNPDTADIPVIFLTGKSDSVSELDGLSLGAVDYITKPFVPPLLIKRIEVHLLIEPVNVYELLNFVKDASDDELRQVDRFHKALALFEKHDWTKAGAEFQNLFARDGGGAARFYAERCALLRQKPSR